MICLQFRFRESEIITELNSLPSPLRENNS